MIGKNDWIKTPALARINSNSEGFFMKITKSMMEIYWITDDDGEAIAGPFFHKQECHEFLELEGDDE